MYNSAPDRPTGTNKLTNTAHAQIENYRGYDTYEADAFAESEFRPAAAALRDLGTLLAATCRCWHRGLGAPVSLSNPRTQTNPASHHTLCQGNSRYINHGER